MAFSDLKKNSQSSIASLNKELEKLNSNKNSFQDDRQWQVERDKSGNGFAILRFLPAPEGEDVPWVRMFNHSFQGPGGKWYIENCPTTIGGKCPCCEKNSELWNTGVKSDQDIARSRKRKLSYYSNVLVVSDPSHRENEGKMFLFRYGKKIHDKIVEAMNPVQMKDSSGNIIQDASEAPTNPFDLWKGRNFKLRVKTVEGYPNYDTSSFEAESALYGGNDTQLEALWKSEHKLIPMVDPKEFKSYDELKEKYTSVMTTSSSSKAATNSSPVEKAPFVSTASSNASAAVSAVSSGNHDNNISFLKKLMEDEE